VWKSCTGQGKARLRCNCHAEPRTRRRLRRQRAEQARAKAARSSKTIRNNHNKSLILTMMTTMKKSAMNWRRLSRLSHRPARSPRAPERLLLLPLAIILDPLLLNSLHLCSRLLQRMVMMAKTTSCLTRMGMTRTEHQRVLCQLLLYVLKRNAKRTV